MIITVVSTSSFTLSLSEWRIPQTSGCPHRPPPSMVYPCVFLLICSVKVYLCSLCLFCFVTVISLLHPTDEIQPTSPFWELLPRNLDSVLAVLPWSYVSRPLSFKKFGVPVCRSPISFLNHSCLLLFRSSISVHFFRSPVIIVYCPFHSSLVLHTGGW